MENMDITTVDEFGSKMDVKDSDEHSDINEDINGLDFIRAFVQNQKLNDYYNKAVYEAEKTDDSDDHKENQENTDPNSRYVVPIYFLKRQIGKLHKG